MVVVGGDDWVDGALVDVVGIDRRWDGINAWNIVWRVELQFW